MLICSILSLPVLAAPFVSQFDNVLGTSLSIHIEADEKQSKVAEGYILTELKRLEKIFSHYQPDTELSQINNGGSELPLLVSNEFLEMVAMCQKWHKKLPMAFSCRLGKVRKQWEYFAEKQQRPNRKSIRTLARTALYSNYQLEDLKLGKPPIDFEWDFDAIAKGYILDKLILLARSKVPSAKAIAIDIGGDTRFWSSDGSNTLPWEITIADVSNIDDSASFNLGQLRSYNGAVAYSGHISRFYKIGTKKYSHIVQPRDGWPKDFSNSAVVFADTAAKADAIATALTAMDVSSGLDWVNSQKNVEALLIDAKGRHHSSDNWYQYFSRSSAETKSNELTEAIVSFSLAKITTNEYRKPYVALWVEDSKGLLLKNLLFLGDNERWMSKNRVWWRRQGKKESDILPLLARPTRRAGEYQVKWLGRDNFGQPLAAGKYKIVLEVVREYGKHEKITILFEPGKPVNKTVEGQQEIKFLQLDLNHYVPVYVN